MIEFAKIYEEWNNYYGYNFDELAHDSLEDVKATLVVYNAIKKKLPSYVWMSTQLLIKEKEVIFESDDVTEVIDKAKELFGQCKRNNGRLWLLHSTCRNVTGRAGS